MKELGFTKKEVEMLFNEFYNRVKHGDLEHQKWLKDETEKFIENEVRHPKDWCIEGSNDYWRDIADEAAGL